MQDDRSPATKADVNILKTNVSILTTDMSGMKMDMSALKTDMSDLKTSLKEFMRVIETRFTHIDERLDTLTRQVKHANDGVDAVLEVVVNTDKRLTGKVDNHEKRIKKLELVKA